jgi:hypothetical protein
VVSPDVDVGINGAGADAVADRIASGLGLGGDSDNNRCAGGMARTSRKASLPFM